MKTVIWISLIVVIVVQTIRLIIDRIEGKPLNHRAKDGQDLSDYGCIYDNDSNNDSSDSDSSSDGGSCD